MEKKSYTEKKSMQYYYGRRLGCEERKKGRKISEVTTDGTHSGTCIVNNYSTRKSKHLIFVSSRSVNALSPTQYIPSNHQYQRLRDHLEDLVSPKTSMYSLQSKRAKHQDNQHIVCR